MARNSATGASAGITSRALSVSGGWGMARFEPEDHTGSTPGHGSRTHIERGDIDAKAA
jgi:hypothetical protein